MPTTSNRVANTPSSPIRRLVPYAEAAKKRGVEVFHLNIGQPDIITPQTGVNALQEADLGVIAYSHSAGLISYREKLVEFYSRYGVTVDTEQMIVTNGGSEALLFAMLACADAGDEVIVPEPFYANYNGFAKSLDITIVPITAHIKDGFALPAMEDFEKKISPKTKAILICNPSNPTGYLYSVEELEKLRTIVKKHDLFLIADEVYRDFCYEGQKHTSILALENMENHAIVIDSISKRYSACGARMGVVLSKNESFMVEAMKLAQARLSPSTLAQILAEGLIDTPQSYFGDLTKEYDHRRQTVINRLQAMEGVVCPNPKGAFYAFVKFPVDNCDKFCQWLLEEFEHNGKTIMMAPGAGFYNTDGLGVQEARIAYVLNSDDLNTAMDCLEAALKAYPGRLETNKIELDVN
ncbi:pyridoxal phosphate-dependent aminotransferase [Aureispira sp. CCB-E]|uniref:pyridoxal phosphate-dependent aminotransferase n=1 Tax=Aureispira sp. CCB-E TaxID=3051121 RepID=UPI0028696D55|nr:pyridoxal phosphate-dependent aminotransferase [Aureispira sp. CCB-E]WMX13458.1 pyridoxal phosphate-dependent aminotransferase [Aureispira sp. CCB-E]